MLFAAFPATVDWLSAVAGVAYPPALIIALVYAVRTVKSLLADIAQTQLRREVRRLNQRVALMDAHAAWICCQPQILTNNQSTDLSRGNPSRARKITNTIAKDV